MISEILLGNNLSRDEHSSVEVLENIVQSFSRQNICDMPPLLLTEEDRQELQRDRENAIKYEEMLARRKQEQHFDLVDKVQNVLRRIEMKKSQKVVSEEVYNSQRSPSDYNNNPSQISPETCVENMASFTSPKHVQRTATNFEEPLHCENSRQPSGKRDKNNRHSLPANFETIYPSAGNDKNFDGVTIGRHHAHCKMPRPLSAYSDSRMVYGNQVAWNGSLDGGHSNGGRVPVTDYRMYPPYQRPLSVMSDNHLLYGGNNGKPASGKETLHHHQSSDPRPLSVMSDNHLRGSNGFSGQCMEIHQPLQNGRLRTDHHHSFTNTSVTTDKHIGQGEVPQKAGNFALRNGNSNAFIHSSVVDNSPVSKSENSLSKQRELLALQQKELEDHYATLQGQLLADFQTKQQELIEVYNQSLESSPHSGHVMMQSILEGSRESDSEETIVSSSIEKFTVLRTEELPQSPFGISVRKHSNSFENGEGKNSSRTIQNSAELRQHDFNTFAKLTNGSHLENFASPSSIRQYYNSSSDTRLVTNSLDQVLGASVTGSSVPPNSETHDRRADDTSIYFLQSSSSPDTRKSFNSEVSAQEYYEMPQFGKKFGKAEIVGNNVERNAGRKNGVVAQTGRNSVKKFGASVVTSPKRTRLDSFESKAMKNLNNFQSHKFFVLSAHAKGFLTRLLFQTAKIVGLVTTVKDAKNVLAEMNTESSQSITDRSFKERVKTQLHSAQSELCRIFVDSPAYVRVQILEQNRKLLEEKQARHAVKAHSTGVSQARPKLSNVTKKRMSRQESHDKTPKSERALTPSSSKVIRGSAKNRSTPKSLTKDTSNASTAKTTPKNKAKSRVLPVSDTTSSETSEQIHSTNAVTSSTTKAAPSVPVTTTASKKIAEEKKQAITKPVNNTSLVKSSKASIKVTQTTKNRRRTWDVGVLKPIQGRISPTIPSERMRSSNEKRQSSLSTARKVGQKVLSEYQMNGLAVQSTTCEVSGIDMTKTYKVTHKPEQPMKKNGARRSLAANLSHK